MHINKYRLSNIMLIVWLLHFPFISLVGQTALKGKILSIDEKGTKIPLSYSSIALHNYEDSTIFIKGTISDEQGNYVFEKLSAGVYLVKVSYMGQRLEKDSIHITNIIQVRNKDFILKENSYQLGEVIVIKNRSFQDKNKKIEMFSSRQIKISKDGLDLISQVPQLFYNSAENTLQDRSGVSMTLLINGIAANSQELRNIPPDKIVRVEYYDIPPIRYSFAGSVVNVVTKRMDSGVNGGVTLSHAFTTGFANDNLYISHVWGNNQINVTSDLNWRNYKDNKQTHDYSFALENIKYDYKEVSDGSFNYITNNTNIGYSYNVPDRFVLQVKFMPYLQNSNSDYSSLYNVFQNNLLSLRQGLRKNHTRYFRPVLGCYINIPFTQTKQFYVDVVGTLYNTRQNNSNKQYGVEESDVILDNFLEANTHKKSLIAEIMYQQELNSSNSFSVGLKSENGYSDADISNILNEGDSYRYTINSSQQCVYMQYEYSKKRFYMSLAMENYYRHSKNSETSLNRFVFAPYLAVRYQINDCNNIGLRMRAYPESPNISIMTKQASLEMENIISYGNPNIEQSFTKQVDLNYSYHSKYFSGSLRTLVREIHDNISEYYHEETFLGKPVMARKWENAPYNKLFRNYMEITLYPLGNKDLVIEGNWIYELTSYRSNYIGKINHNYNGLFFSASYRTTKYGINSYYRIPGKYFSSLYINKDENNSGFDFYYNIGNCRLSASWMFMFEPSLYERETQKNSPLQESWTSKIANNKNLITIGVSWNFNKGKSLALKRKLSNNDDDAGVL